MASCLIGMEACAGAHHVGRQLAGLGHDVRLIPATYVKPFLKGHKNDYRDAEATAEAVQRPTMRFVPLKSSDQLDLQALHRVRSRLVGQRTAVINQIRGFLLEWLASATQRLHKNVLAVACQQARENHVGGTSSGQPIRTRLYCTGRVNSLPTPPRQGESYQGSRDGMSRMDKVTRRN
jgi:transposase